MFKFIHAADIHLDSPLLNLEQYDGAPVDALRTATRQALENLVALALKEDVNFVLIAGDVYDGDWDSTRTGLHFSAQMSKLRAADISVYVIAGNHDAKNKMTKNLRLPDNVRYLSEKRAETIDLPDLGVKIHGQSFAKPAVLENLALQYPAADRGSFNVGLLHTCATCSGHESYAPCTLEDMRNKGYNYWALGHIHQRAILCHEPLIAFSGNLQGRHIRETDAKGCLLVTVDDTSKITAEFQPLDVLRWERCHVDATEAATPDALLDVFVATLANLRELHKDLPLALRIEVVGASAVHQTLMSAPQKWADEFRNMANINTDGQVWIEKVNFGTRPLRNLQSLGLSEGPLGELQSLIAELLGDESKLIALAAELTDLQRKMPSEVKNGPDAVQLDDPHTLRELLTGVGPMLSARLGSQQVRQ